MPTVSVALLVNGVLRALELDPRVTLLDAPRDHLRLTGTKKGCDQGTCAIANALFHATGHRIRSLPITLERLL